MLCKKPFFKMGGGTFPCGQCLHCRLNRRRMWTHRIVLESYLHEECCFVTLTYDDDHLPDGETLVPEHLRNWLKRLRRALEPTKIRYYAVGEYGDESQRPHYHACLFGIGKSDQEQIDRAWSKGFTYTGDLTADSAQYTAGYTVKKLTNADDPELGGRYPEFARMSNRPGIGADAVSEIADAVKEVWRHQTYCDLDVPFSMSVGRKSFPIGRYLRHKLRDELGMPEGGRNSMDVYEKSKELSLLLSDKIANSTSEPHTLANVLAEKNRQKLRNAESRSKIYKQRKTL